MHTIARDIEFDPGKDAVNQRNHGVGFVDAEQVLRDPHAMTREDPDAESEPRFVTLGMDTAGRVLVVVWTPRGDKARLISARKAGTKEVAFYAQGI